jgi:hypothetical protein
MPWKDPAKRREYERRKYQANIIAERERAKRRYLCDDPLPDDRREIATDHDGFALDDPDRLRRIAASLEEARRVVRARQASLSAGQRGMLF